MRPSGLNAFFILGLAVGLAGGAWWYITQEVGWNWPWWWFALFGVALWGGLVHKANEHDANAALIDRIHDLEEREKKRNRLKS